LLRKRANTMSDIDPAKLQAARAAAEIVQSGMTIGLGSGSTAALFVRALGERVRNERLVVTGVPTSESTESLARGEGMTLTDLDRVDTLDLDVDGADEVDPQFRMIKGLGGALLREKIVAAASRRRVIIITPSKRVQRLGHGSPVPVEVCTFGLSHTERALQAMGAETSLRRTTEGLPFQTDEGHRILDCHFHGGIDEPEVLARRLKEIVGVFETGLFLELCDLLVIGHTESVEFVERTSAQ
jgi:ribose 5-phosphate isomerase A